MVKIRLKRVGKRKQPSYRVVVADSRSPRDGRIIESIGHYHPLQSPSGVSIDTERAEYWISRGAQPSNTVAKLLEIMRSGGAEAAGGGAPKTTPAGSVRATPAASVEEPDEVVGPEEAGAEVGQTVEETTASAGGAAETVEAEAEPVTAEAGETEHGSEPASEAEEQKSSAADAREA